MGKITEEKTYEGRQLEDIFFRPMLTGPNAIDLGIRMLYNVPVPTTLTFWKSAVDVLRKYKKGFDGGDPAKRESKTISLSKVKAELAYSAEEYFNTVYELITNRADVNLDDLSGTELEAAETTLFKEAIAESIRATMWLGDTTREGEGAFNSFDGFLKRIIADAGTGENDVKIPVKSMSMEGDTAAQDMFKSLWENAPIILKQFKSQGNLVYLVTSDIMAKYEDELAGKNLESSFTYMQQGVPTTAYRGIPVKDIQIAGYADKYPDMPNSFAILTDKRNLAVAVNTNSYPGSDVRMWYNPDEMENRQRAIFMAGCDYLLPELLVCALNVDAKIDSSALTATGGTLKVTPTATSLITKIEAQGYNASNAADGTKKTLTASEGVYSATLSCTAATKVVVTTTFKDGSTQAETINIG